MTLKMTVLLNVTIKVRKNEQQKCATCFATLLQNETRGHVARATTHKSMTFLATNQFVDCYASHRSLKWRAISLRYGNNAVITVLVREQKPYPV